MRHPTEGLRNNFWSGLPAAFGGAEVAGAQARVPWCPKGGQCVGKPGSNVLCVRGEA